jgi:ATP-binding protein involved in chromosome partitioning
MTLTKESVLEALKTVDDPELHQDLVTLGMVKEVQVQDDGKLNLNIELTTPACPLKDKIAGDIEAALRTIDGFQSVEIEWSARVRNSLPEDKAALVPGIRNIIGVSSGKGGVGKSTVAANLAIALGQTGAKVALLDADIYGPNVPTIMGVTGRPKVEDNKIVPLENWGVKVMSMGFLIDEDQPVIWRGPMLNKALRQFFADVAWGELDYLVVDLPPGTGDVQLSLFQLVPITGVVCVTTPQQVALSDVKKGIMQWREFRVPILGIIENMSYFISPSDGERFEIFSHGGGADAAAKYETPFLGEIPLAMEIREGSDAGKPLTAVQADHPVSQKFLEVASNLAAQVSIVGIKGQPAPTA